MGKSKTFYAMVHRVDGSEFHAATITAIDQDQALRAYSPDYGFGVRMTEFAPQSRTNPNAIDIIGINF
jgi:hypothetical protein